MKILNSYAELVDLPLYEMVLLFTGSTYKMYHKVGYRNQLKDMVYLVSSSSNTDVLAVYESLFDHHKTFVTGKFDAKFVGRLLLEKLNEEIKSVEETYLTRH